jgi:hypothetical protein
MLSIVSTSSNLLIGDLEGDILKQPYMIMLAPGEKGEMLIFISSVIGKPNEIKLINPAFSYEVEDDQIKNMYLERITGLTLPSKKVVPFKMN